MSEATSTRGGVIVVVEGIHPFAIPPWVLYVRREKKITFEPTTLRNVRLPRRRRSSPNRDDGPSTRCNCSITLLCLSLSVSLLPSSLSLSSSLSHTHPVASPNGVLYFVIQYVGVRAPPLWIRMEGRTRSDRIRACV